MLSERAGSEASGNDVGAGAAASATAAEVAAGPLPAPVLAVVSSVTCPFVARAAPFREASNQCESTALAAARTPCSSSSLSRRTASSLAKNEWSSGSVPKRAPSSRSSARWPAHIRPPTQAARESAEVARVRLLPWNRPYSKIGAPLGIAERPL